MTQQNQNNSQNNHNHNHQQRRQIATLFVLFVSCWCLVVLYLHSTISSEIRIASNNGSSSGGDGFDPPKLSNNSNNNNSINNQRAAAAAAAAAAIAAAAQEHSARGKQQKQQQREQRQRQNVAEENNNHAVIAINNNNINNPWYGWQPIIAKQMECSWRECFKNFHTCSTCRDRPEDLGQVPIVPEDENGNPQWIPDVTMLKRMYLDGHDSNGIPWPPLLNQTKDDDVLCEPIGPSGGTYDENVALLQGVPIKAEPLTFDDKGPTILCLMYTMEKSHATSVRAHRETWAPGCDGFLAFSTKTDPRIPAISIPHDGKEEYNNMWQKVRSIWKFVGEHYIHDFDFFYIGGDDLFVLPQNLRNFLSNYNPNDDHFLGRRFKGYGAPNNYFNSGGAGYVLSRATLQKFVTIGLDHPLCNPNRHTPMEDVMVAECLREVFHIPIEDTRDEQGRERFHPFSPGSHLTWRPPKPGAKADWYEEYNKEWGLKLGLECCAPDSVSFHYIKKPAMVRHLHKLLYYDCNNNKR